MFHRLLFGTALSGLLVPVVASAESAALGSMPSTSQLQHPAQLAPSASSQYLPFQPRISVNGALGSDRSLAITEGWAPLWQDDFNVFYGDIRAMVDDGNNEEYNLGFGYRALRGDQIGGLHAWLDKRDTSLGSTFYQATIGAELLTYDTDLRFNMYIPITGSKHHTTPNVGSATPYLAGSGIFYDTTGILAEEPQKGLDLEAGYRLPVMQQYVDAFRVYGGGYAFLGNEADDVVGLRARTQVDVNPWLSIGARVQRDDERGTQGFLEATLRFPVTSKKMIQREGVRARMDESPERDVDIVTGAKQVDTGLRKSALNAETGVLQRVLHVDNSNSNAGDGSKENPYNSLEKAQAALLPHDIVYVHAGTGTSLNMDKGFTVAADKVGVSLIGSGSNFYWDSGKFGSSTVNTPVPETGLLIAAATTAPVITNTQTRTNDFTGNGITVLADNTYISGMTVSGVTGHGIVALNSAGVWDNFTVTNTNALNSTWYGIYTSVSNGAQINNITFDNNISKGNVNRASFYVQANNATVGNILIANNVASNNAHVLGRGISIDANNGATMEKIAIQQNIVRDTNGSGIVVSPTTNGKINDVDISDNKLTNTALTGIYLYADNGQMNKALVEKNEITGTVNGAGISFYANNATGRIVNAQMIGNISKNNTSGNGNGFHLGIANGGTVEASLENNLASGNAQNGFYVRAVGIPAASISVSMQGNTAVNNTINGVLLDNDATAVVSYVVDLGNGALDSVGRNSFYNNTSRDIYVDTVPATGSGTLVHAENNWWGNAAGLVVGRYTLEGTSTLNATHYLPSAP